MAMGLWGLLAAGCASSHQLTGQVLDETGAPVEGAEVETRPATDVRATSVEGRFAIMGHTRADGTLSPLRPGEYVVIARKLPDHDPVEQTVTVDGTTSVELTLVGKQADIGPAVPPEPLPEPKIDPTQPGPPSDGQ